MPRQSENGLLLYLTADRPKNGPNFVTGKWKAVSFEPLLVCVQRVVSSNRPRTSATATLPCRPMFAPPDTVDALLSELNLQRKRHAQSSFHANASARHDLASLANLDQLLPPAAASRAAAVPLSAEPRLVSLQAAEAEVSALRRALCERRARIEELRRALADRGVDEPPSAPPPSEPPGPPTDEPPARSCPECKSGSLTGAIARRLDALEPHALALRAELDSLRAREEQLSEHLRTTGLDMPPDSAAAPFAASSSGHQADTFQPHQLVEHLRVLNEAVEYTQELQGLRAPIGVVGLGAAAPKARPATVPVTVFADGFMLYRGPFRPWPGDEARRFVREVAGGRLPRELQAAHPAGALFDIRDASDSTHARAAATASATSARVVGVAGREAGATLLAPQSREQLLARLPSAVVRKGDVLAVRSEIADMLGGRRPPLAPYSAKDGPDMEKLRAARLQRFGVGARDACTTLN